jgi:hypothetical protein
MRMKLRRVTSFCNHAISGFAKRSLDPNCDIFSDGLACFAAMLPRLTWAAVRTPPMPFRLLKLAEVSA